MSIDEFQGQQLNFNDTITYITGTLAAVNPDAPAQPAGQGPYTGRIVDFVNNTVGVRANGFVGNAPLYYVWPSDILFVEPVERPPEPQSKNELEDEEILAELYGSAARYSDYKRGDRITYRRGKGIMTGKILWVCAPGRSLIGQEFPLRYFVTPDRGRFPHCVYQSDIIGCKNGVSE